jgi:hypothetical protein
MAKKAIPMLMNEPKSEAEWKARSDAQALICAEEVMADKKRFSMALKAAKTMKAELEHEMKAVSKISKKGK